MTDSLGPFTEGTTVTMVDSHHAHNSELKKNVGRNGIIRSVSTNREKCLVEFEGMTGKVGNRWWVSPEWLDVIDDD